MYTSCSESSSADSGLVVIPRERRQKSCTDDKQDGATRPSEPNLGHIITSDGHSKSAVRATNKALGGQTKHKISKDLCVSYNVKIMTSEVMHTSDGPTNPRTRRVLKKT